MLGIARTRTLFAVLAAVIIALAGATVTAAPAQAAGNWNIPWKDIRYPFYPQCNTHMNAFVQGYGTMTCKGEYTVNRRNYKFTQDNINRCPLLGTVQHITLNYVLNPASGGVTWTKVLAGFRMHW